MTDKTISTGLALELPNNKCLMLCLSAGLVDPILWKMQVNFIQRFMGFIFSDKKLHRILF